MATRVAHLYALEQVFDRSVRLAQARFPWRHPRVVAKAVALWVADEARAELLLREMSSEWMDRVISELASTARPNRPSAPDPRRFGPQRPCFA